MFVSYQIELIKARFANVTPAPLHCCYSCCLLCHIQADFSTDDWGEELLPDVYGGEMKCTATLKLDMELSDFPFDVQDAILRIYQVASIMQ